MLPYGLPLQRATRKPLSPLPELGRHEARYDVDAINLSPPSVAMNANQPSRGVR